MRPEIEAKVEVVYGLFSSRLPGELDTERSYAYRTGGKVYRIGDVVEVPPTSLTGFRGGVEIATVVAIDSDYAGPTHEIIGKHKHRYVPRPALCRCGREHA